MDQNWAKSSYLIKTCTFLPNLGLNNVLCSRWNIDFTTHTHLIWLKKYFCSWALKMSQKLTKHLVMAAIHLRSPQKKVFDLNSIKLFFSGHKMLIPGYFTNRLNSLTVNSRKKKLLSVLWNYSHYKDTNRANVSISNEKCTIFALFWIK